MGKTIGRCEACGEAVLSARAALTIEGRRMLLCDADRAALGDAPPKTLQAAEALLEPSKLERRQGKSRRRRPDRRLFLRPEGRRASAGRRRTDPRS